MKFIKVADYIINVDVFKERFIKNCKNCSMPKLLSVNAEKEVCKKCIQRQFNTNYADLIKEKQILEEKNI